MTEPKVVKPAKWRPSIVWIIPIVAAIVSLSLLFHSFNQRGERIEITFRTAEGLAAGQTKVKYKDVDIGEVREIRLSRDRASVVVEVELSRDVSEIAVEDSRFWVVRPRVAASGVSGLGTLLSGAYIGVDVGDSTQRTTEFIGLETPPVVTQGLPGKEFLLRAQNLGSIDIGAPVYYRNISVGQVTAFELDQNGAGVTVKIFVHEPYDKYVRTSTRFWNASGIDVEFGAGGVKLHTESVVSILMGGIAFLDVPNSPLGDEAAAGTVFALAEKQGDALKPDDGQGVRMVLNFDQTVRGLSVGAPVDFRGVVIGEVKEIGIQYQPARRNFLLPVEIEIFPSRLGLNQTRAAGGGEQDLLAVLVREGLRAQLRTANLLTGQMYVAIDFMRRSARAELRHDGDVLVFPTVAGTFNEMDTKIAGIVDKISKVPFEALADDLRGAINGVKQSMVSTEALVKQVRAELVPEISQAMADAREVLKSAEALMTADAPLQQDLRRTLQELARTANSIKALTDYLEENPQALLRGKPKE